MTKTAADITDYKFTDNIRDRLIKRLIVANEQLEQFAYVASHDLREPLRIVVSFTDLLAKEYGAGLDDNGWNYVAIIRQAAKKMETMIADLLDYGRLGQSSEHFVEANCDKILQQAIQILGESIKTTGASIQSDPLPTVMVNPIRISRLFQNLIGNALKYQPVGRAPVICISAEDKDVHWQFAVADNGIGIEGQYLETIFAPFKRLHSDQEYGGTGIGLAICRRIVESFDGMLWAESTVGTGSVFYFTIPKRAEA